MMMPCNPACCNYISNTRSLVPGGKTDGDAKPLYPFRFGNGTALSIKPRPFYPPVAAVMPPMRVSHGMGMPAPAPPGPCIGSVPATKLELSDFWAAQPYTILLIHIQFPAGSWNQAAFPMSGSRMIPFSSVPGSFAVSMPASSNCFTAVSTSSVSIPRTVESHGS